MTFKQFFTVWTEEFLAWLTAKFNSIDIDLTPVEEKTDEIITHSLTHTQNNYQAGDSQINRIVVNYTWLGLTNTCKNYDLIGTETVDGVLYYKWATANEMPVEYVYTTKWKDLTAQGGDTVYVKNGDVMERLTNPYGNYVNTWQAQSIKNATKSDVKAVDDKIGDLNDIIESINGDTVDNIVDMYLDDESEQIENIIGDWNNE